jgi:hypothetical protein
VKKIAHILAQKTAQRKTMARMYVSQNSPNLVTLIVTAFWPISVAGLINVCSHFEN